jgi:hypothetical protein
MDTTKTEGPPNTTKTEQSAAINPTCVNTQCQEDATNCWSGEMKKPTASASVASAQIKPAGPVLVVGLCCVDIVNYVDGYPPEDSDRRVLEQVWSAGWLAG